jgi:hypothetical protein
MRPTINVLGDELIGRILTEAKRCDWRTHKAAAK